MSKTKEAVQIWNRYQITLQMEGEFGASIPKTEKEIRGMLENRMPKNKPDGGQPIEDLVEEVSSQVDTEEETEFGWLTFKRDDEGLLYEGRCIRGHLKDCALAVKDFFPDIKVFRSKVVNRMYIEESMIPVYKDDVRVTEPDEAQQRFIQVMTRQGPRSTIKYVDYVDSPTITFHIRLLNDGLIDIDHIKTMFEYGATHGMGAERSQGWGRYSVVDIKQI